jgi:glycosyltransferase involved in cell wall biosynthesis
MPLISVVIPVFNGERTIKETIESVLRQTFADFEIIIINDGCQDATVEIVSNIQDSRIQVYSYPNAGLAASRNRGINHASSEYIAFIDADDLWTPDKLEAQLNSLKANPDAAVAYSWTDYIDQSSQFLRRGSHITVNGDIYPHLLVIDFLENGSNPLIRKQAFVEVGNFDESLTAAEDWDLLLRLARRYPFVCVPSPQILYRISGNSMSDHILRQESESLKVIERAFNQAPESLQYLKKQSLANLYKYLTYKAMEVQPKSETGLTAARFLLQAVRNDPSLLKAKVIGKVLFKISAMILLPSQLAQTAITKFRTLSNTTTLLGYIQKLEII